MYSKLAILLAGTLFCTSCTTMDTQQRSTLGGAAGGAALGAILGNNAKGLSKGEGAVAGALLGGLLGNAYGGQQQQIQGLQGQIDAAQSRVINLTNSNGSTTPVVVRQTPQGFVGPRGELYSQMPTSAQLRPVYGF